MKGLGKQVLALVCLLALPVGALFAGTIEVSVLDRKGNPVPDVIVLAESTTGEPLQPAAGQPSRFEVDQQNLQFVPHVLVVPARSTVNFLNSDVTAHHVYSFSKTKRFTLPLYKGRAPDPVVFETPGIVTLGCNIHDHMVGYVVVAESHLHTRTDADGKASLAVEGDVDDIRIRIWSPRIKDRKKHLVQLVSDTTPLRFSLKKTLRPAHGAHQSDSSEWEEYSQ